MSLALLRGPLTRLTLILLLGSPCATSHVHAQVGSTASPLIRDTPSLVEPFDASAPSDIAAVAAETQGALMLTSALTLTDTTAAINPSPTLSEVWQLCDGELFEEQPTAAFCSGTLIAADLLLTAEHCIPNKRSCDALSVVFDYRYTSAGVLAPLERDDVYGCDRIMATDATSDYTIIRLDRAVVGRAPAQPRVSDPSTCLGVRAIDRVWAAGFPSGVPLKLDLGDVDDADMPLGVGIEVINVSSRRFFRGRFDLFAGMDGGGVFIRDLDAVDAGVDGAVELVGFLSSGRADYARTDDGCYAAVHVTDAGNELAGHVIQPLVALCNRSIGADYPALCPDTVRRCFPGNVVIGADAGTTAFPPQVGCGCRVPSANPESPHGTRAGLGVVVGFLLLLGARARRRLR